MILVRWSALIPIRWKHLGCSNDEAEFHLLFAGDDDDNSNEQKCDRLHRKVDSSCEFGQTESARTRL